MLSSSSSIRVSSRSHSRKRTVRRASVRLEARWPSCRAHRAARRSSSGSWRHPRVRAWQRRRRGRCPTSVSPVHTAWASSTIGVDASGEVAVVGKRLDGRVGQGVDGVGTDQLVDVQRVGVGRVLGRRAGPQRPLHSGTLGGQRLPPMAAEGLLEHAGRPACPGRRAPLPRSARASGRADRLESMIDLGVDPADEEAGHAGDRRQIGARLRGEQLSSPSM